MKLCECGCGQPAPLATESNKSKGWIKGQPKRFLKGHSGGVAVKTHGMAGTPEFSAFNDARDRCTNPNSGKWADYGGRGIQFRFENFEQFLFVLGPRPTAQHSLDREDNEGHYEAGNVRWATKSDQALNRRTPQKGLFRPA